MPFPHDEGGPEEQGQAKQGELQRRHPAADWCLTGTDQLRARRVWGTTYLLPDEVEKNQTPQGETDPDPVDRLVRRDWLVSDQQPESQAERDGARDCPAI